MFLLNVLLCPCAVILKNEGRAFWIVQAKSTKHILLKFNYNKFLYILMWSICNFQLKSKLLLLCIHELLESQTNWKQSMSLHGFTSKYWFCILLGCEYDWQIFIRNWKFNSTLFVLNYIFSLIVQFFAS